eukprot:GHRQ01019658.1.p4 GENE.GHRQ01019658.1~~GHRQ01019658.1.p4  ORF type:complete len:126 (-),score=40.90 GHRQ01019658.1:1113-1490(-)
MPCPAVLAQVPVFVYTAASIRYMARADWPGFSSEGALWFPDLTQQAVQLSQAADSALLLPMGLPGLLLPLAVTGIMLTSIRLGFKASGGATQHDASCQAATATLRCVLCAQRRVQWVCLAELAGA